LALFYQDKPFSQYIAQAHSLDLIASGDTEHEALRELVLLLRQWAGECAEQELDPDEPNLLWKELPLALRFLQGTDLDDSIRLLRSLAGPPTLRTSTPIGPAVLPARYR
jgi:hypothetical protein